MSTSQHLPNELIISILDEAQQDDLLPRYKWLKRYSRVCRAWRPYAQQLLFTHVALNSGAAQCRLFKNAVTKTADTEHAAFLRGCVRTLSIVVDHQAIYTEIIEICPNIRELHLSMFHASFRPEALGCLWRGPRVEALRIRAFYCKPILQILSVYRRAVQFLEVDFNSVRDQASIAEDEWPMPLTELKDLRFSTAERYPNPFLLWALSGSAQTLEVLHIRCPGLQIEPLVELGVGPSLRSLGIPASLGCTSDLAAFAPSLEDVEFSMPLLSSILESPDLFGRLPLGLVHLSLHDSNGIGQHIRQYIGSLAAYCDRAEGSLKTLSFHCRTLESERAADARLTARTLFDFCKTRNILYRLFDPPYGFYAREAIPFGPVRTFPRSVPLSDRRRLIVDEEYLDRRASQRPISAKILRGFVRSFGSTIPPVALAKP
ncbi:hypothetical protein C2E23DRAFT_729898 [Lenzites betulinus]|nr:hypothetical protein C2E23DRAFT_729898 [Lenzites betulinus]